MLSQCNCQSKIQLQPAVSLKRLHKIFDLLGALHSSCPIQLKLLLCLHTDSVPCGCSWRLTAYLLGMGRAILVQKVVVVHFSYYFFSAVWRFWAGA